MVIIQENFTDLTSILKKEKKRRQETNFNTDETIENQIWLFLLNIGFSKLNVGRQCQVYCGKTKESLVIKNIDIVAECIDARLYIRCTTQQDSTLKIKNWINDANFIRKYEATNPETALKNVAYILFSEQEINTNDKLKLKEEGIQVLNENNLEYFHQLGLLYKNLAYYQLLSYLLNGQDIKRCVKEEYDIPAIRCKYTNKDYCYLFGIQPAKLIPLTTVLHRKMDIGNEMDVTENYQRLVKKNKIEEIKKFVTKERGIFPTNIVLSFDSKGKNYFNPIGQKINDIQYGILTLPRKYQSITIIDGQHRLFAYDGLNESQTDLIYVIGFHKMDPENQVQTFVNINEKQTKVSPSLMWDLYPSILDPHDMKSRISKLVKNLNEKNRNSALFGVISYDSAPYSNKGSKITLESFCTAIKAGNILGKLCSEFEILNIKNQNDTIAYSVIEVYFNCIQELDSEHWNRKEKTRNLLRSNQGIGALIRLFIEIFDYLRKRNGFDRIRSNDYSSLTAEIKKILKPVISLASSLKTSDEIRKFKRIGEGGKQQLFKDFMKEINKEINDFGIDYLNSLENEEIESLLTELNQNAESDTIEVKEAFFTDTKKLKATSKLEQNSDEAIKGIIKTVVAFSNYHGGRVVFGLVDRTWEIIGLDETDLKIRRDWDTLKQSISQKIKSETEGLIIAPEIRKIIHNQKTLAIIDVKPITKKRFEEQELVSLRSDNNCYKRENGDSVIIKANEIKKYCNQVLKEIEEKENSEISNNS